MSTARAGLIAVALGAALAHAPAAGQTHAELRGGLTVGNHTATLAGLDIAPALSFEALLIQQVTPRLSVYGGYLRTAFGCEEGFCLDRDLTVTFFVKNQTARSKIEQYQTDLKHLLNPFFNQTLLRVVISEKKIDDFEYEDVQIADERRVDLRI